jgi:hypothetical protein
MKLHGIIEVRVHGERVLRDPRFWDKVKTTFGGTADLRTDRVRAEIEAATLVEGTRRALTQLGVENAISLVIDRQVLFEDRQGRPDDLVDLMAAFHENAPVFGSEFELLRLVVEHEEAGLHVVVETMARSVHPVDETAARVVVGGRIRDFEPRSGETADAYRARVEPLMATPAVFETHRLQFESFVARLADALRGTLADAEINVREAEARVEKPERAPSKAPPVSPTDRRYDPYDTYYPSPLPGVLTMVMWGSMLSWAMMPHYTIINHAGTALGATDALGHDELAAVAGGEDLDAAALAGDVGADGFGDGFGVDEIGGDVGDFDFDFFDW